MKWLESQGIERKLRARGRQIGAVTVLLVALAGCNDEFTAADGGGGAGTGGEGAGGEPGVPQASGGVAPIVGGAPSTGGDTATSGTGGQVPCAELRTVQEYKADYSEDKADEEVRVDCPSAGTWCQGFEDGAYRWSCVAATGYCTAGPRC